MRWPGCVKHDGRHLSIWGQCVHRGAPVALRPGVCPEPGCAAGIMRRLDLQTGRVTTIEEGSDRLHVHAPPPRVEIDHDELAQGIAGALYGLMERRREQRAQNGRSGDVGATSAQHEGARVPPSLLESYEE